MLRAGVDGDSPAKNLLRTVARVVVQEGSAAAHLIADIRQTRRRPSIFIVAPANGQAQLVSGWE